MVARSSCSCCSRTSVARVLNSGTTELSPPLVQPPSNVHDLPQNTRVPRQLNPSPPQTLADLAPDLRSATANPAAARGTVRTRKRALREVAVVELAGRLADVVEDLDRALQLALADEPRGVVCDLSGVPEGSEMVAIEVLATAGRHVRDWPGIPVAVACGDLRLRQVLAAHPLGGHLILTASLFSAVTAVLATPALAVESLRLAPHPTAPRASRDFVSRTLLGWQLCPVIPFASLVVSELVASSTVYVGTDVDVSLAWNLDALRLTVRDHGPGLPRQAHSDLDLHPRGLTVVAGLARAFGVLPSADGGKVVWAVLEAPLPRLSTRRIRSDRDTSAQDGPVFKDGFGLAGPPFCAGSSGSLSKDLPSADGPGHTPTCRRA
jgi:hypothetical protein